MACFSYAAFALWLLGYPDQALKRSQQALLLAQELAHPNSLAFALSFASDFHLLRRELQPAQERTEALITLSTEQGFAFWLAQGTIKMGAMLVQQGQVMEGSIRMCQGLAARQATGAELGRPVTLAGLSDAYRKAGQAEDGLNVVVEALAAVDKTGERFYEAELYRLKGELLLNNERGMQLPRRVGITHQSVSNAETRTVGRAHPTEERSRSVFSQGHRDCPEAASEIAGTPRRHEPRPLMATTRQARRRSQAVV